MARNNSFIPSEQVAGFARWRFGTVGLDGVALGGIEDPEALDRAHAAGWAEGHAAGRAEALAEAEARMAAHLQGEGAEAARRFAALFAAAEAGLAEARQDIARGTLEIACALARQVLRHEIATRPDALEPVVREALGLLLADGKSAHVRLAAVDFERLAAPLAHEFGNRGVTVVADAAIAPGDCLVEAAGAVVDGGVATRWARAVAALGLQMPWQQSPTEEAPVDPAA